MMNFDKAMNWMAAFCIGYVIGISIAALVVFYWRG
jgi:hypothetical protein